MRPFSALEVPLVGRVLVEASAGTGKTRALTDLYVRLLVERGLRAPQILMVTYTEAAASQLRERVRSRIDEAIAAFGERSEAAAPSPDPVLDALVQRSHDRAATRQTLRRARAELDRAPIHTIHGFCQRLLRERGLDFGVAPDAKLVPDLRPLLEQVVRDAWIARVATADPAIVRALGPLKLSEITDLAAAILERPHLRVRPKERVPMPQEPDPAALERAFAHARDLFDAEAIAAALTKARAISGSRRYRAHHVAKWIQRTPNALHSVTTDPLSDDARNLTASAVDEGLPPTDPSAPLPSTRHPFFAAMQALHAELEAHAGFRETVRLAVKRQLIDDIKDGLRRRKTTLSVFDFADLLTRVHDALRGPRGPELARSLRELYRAALVDEFQDTDPTQLSIFEAIFPESPRPLEDAPPGRTRGKARQGPNEAQTAFAFTRATDDDSLLVLVGDPKQAIYGFRGADIHTYLRAAAGIPDARRFTMMVNWRSDPDLVEGVRRLFDRPDPFVVAGITLPNVTGRADAESSFFGPEHLGRAPAQLIGVPDDGRTKELMQIAAVSAQEIALHLEGGCTIDGRPLHAGDIAVLVRRNDEARAIERELQRLGLPSVFLGARSVLETDEASELIEVLRAVAHPRDRAALRVALATDLLGGSLTSLAALREGGTELDRIVEAFEEHHACWHAKGLLPMLRELLARHDVPRRLLGQVRGERRLTNILHVAELLARDADTRDLGPSELVSFAQLHRQRTATDPDELRLESDAHAIRILTTHRAKGLEFPFVVCPMRWVKARERTGAAIYHDAETDETVLDLAKRHATDEDEALSEELRLTYVALTRARHRMLLVFLRDAHGRGAPLPYLLDPDGLPDAQAGKPAPRGTAKKDKKRPPDLLEAASRFADGVCIDARLPAGHTQTESAPTREKVSAPPASGPPALRYFPPRSFVPEQITSFTGLSRALETSGDVYEHRDSDASREPMLAEDPSSAGLDRSDPALRPDDLTSSRILLADFPSGRHVGTFFHRVLETWTPSQDDTLGAIVARELARAQLEPALGSVACEALRASAVTSFFASDPSLRLDALSPASSCHEFEFLLPIDDRPSSRGLSSTALASPFERWPTLACPASYGRAVRDLAIDRVHGFLRGFVDLVFEHDGRWFLADYKSNHLGVSADDYTEARLRPLMLTHHYCLQYHLYVVALDRHLRATLPGYDYETHLGGVFFLFLRGLHPERGAATGVFFDRPPGERIVALSSVLSAMPDPSQEGAP